MRSTEPDQPLDPDDFPPELQDALRRMSQRGPVVDMGTGAVVAQDGQLVHELVACQECARAIGLGWWGAIARHPGPPDKPVCVLCCEGEATLTPAQWFTVVAQRIAAHVQAGKHKSWRDDSLRGLGITPPPG
jgi:hypothetical protein